MLRITRNAEDGDWKLSCDFCKHEPFSLALETKPSWVDVITEHARWPEDNVVYGPSTDDPDAAPDADEWVPPCEMRRSWVDTEWLLSDLEGTSQRGVVAVFKATRTIRATETPS
jgi:hypothetical protein